MIDRPAGCKAYQVSDQATCPACSLTWDLNDPEPPLCKTQHDPVSREAQSVIEHRARRERKYQYKRRAYG